MKKTKALGYISIACDGFIIGILSSFILGNQKTLTMKQIYILLIIALISIACKAFSDLSSEKN